MPILKTSLVGYNGYASIGTIPILCTGGSSSVQNSIIYTAGVWGGGYDNGFRNVCFALDYPIFTTQINFQLTSGFYDVFKTWMQGETRSSSSSISVYPDGAIGYNGNVYCQSVSFQTNQDSLVTGSVTAKGASYNTTATSTLTKPVISTLAPNYKSVYPYWGSIIKIGGSSVSDLISWSITKSTTIVFAKSCNKTTSTIVNAQYVALGLLQGEGNYSRLCSASLGSSHFSSINLTNSIVMNNASGGDKKTITVNKIYLKQCGINAQTGNSLIQTDYNFTVIGDSSTEAITFGQS